MEYCPTVLWIMDLHSWKKTQIDKKQRISPGFSHLLEMFFWSDQRSDFITAKLYKTQTKVMTRDARSFGVVTGNNHTKSCRLLVPHFHKLGWQEIHTFHKKLLKNSAAPVTIIADSIATCSRRYHHIWKNYLKDALNLGISGVGVENVLWRVRDISLQHATLFLIIPCVTNNVDHIQPENIAVRVMKIAENFMKNHPKITTIITGVLPRERHSLLSRQKTMKQITQWKKNGRTSHKNILWIKMTNGFRAVLHYIIKIFFN